MTGFAIDGRPIGPDHPPFVIAELSANHNGSLDRALETISAAKNSGADAVKLQTYTADTLTMDCRQPDFLIKGGLWDGSWLYDLYKQAHTPFEWHEAMFAHARKLGIMIFSTPFDETAVDLLESLDAPAYKIASFELVDLPLIERVARTGKPLIMSTGMANETEVGEAAETARAAGCTQLSLLHCISSYPAPMDQANLRKIPELARMTGAVVGLSDHTMGTTAAVTSVALGACIIEKHFMLDGRESGPDSAFSIEPEGMRHLCHSVRDAWLALGHADFSTRSAAEAGNTAFRRSVYFVRDLPAGAVVKAEDVRRIRPGYGLAPRHLDKIIGRRLKVAVSRGTATAWELFE